MSKPKKQEYKPTEAEKMQASIALKEKQDFDRMYGPLLRETRDLSEKEDFSATARGRANADTMQALTAKPSIQATRSVDAAADVASAAGGQLAQADVQALTAKRKRQVGVLGTARGQQADATTGLSSVARIENTKSLQAAKDKQMVRDATTSALIKVGTTGGLTYAAKKGGAGDPEKEAELFKTGSSLFKNAGLYG